MSTFVQVVVKRPWKTQGKSKMTTAALLATSEAHCLFLYPHAETKHTSVPVKKYLLYQKTNAGRSPGGHQGGRILTLLYTMRR